MFVALDNIILPTFRKVADDIIECNVDRAVLNGGRSSTKSQVVSECIIIGCMTYKSSAVAMVKHANKIEERLVNTFKASISYLGVEKWWKLRKSPYEYVLLDKHGKETNVSIKFTGCDDADSLKSYKDRSGKGFRYVWFEELTNFASLKEVNNIIQTMARGQGKHCVIMTYNPPMSTSSWVNKEYNAPCGKVLGYDSNTYTEELTFEVDGDVHKSIQVVHHSTYLDVIAAGHKDWLGLTFIAEAEQAKQNNERYYRWAYLGEVVGTDANVFENIYDWQYTEDFHYTEICRGLDCSNGGQDPWAYGNWYYDRKNRDLYCLDEFVLGGDASIENVALNVKRLNKYNMNFYIDSAVPTFRRLLVNEGLTGCLPAKKGKDSVMAGILWLKSLNHIFIDKRRCPHTFQEFSQYEYLIDKNDEITSELVDSHNHCIDACRYALCMKIKYDT